MASMLYIYVSPWAGARSRKPVVQRCVDCMLTMLALGTQIGVCRRHSPDEVPALPTRNCERFPVTVL